jgi:hypothetical protein
MQTHPTNNESKPEYARYETLGEPHVERVGETGFVEVVHKRATLHDGRTRDFVLIARGYWTRAGRRVTKSLVTIPAEVAPAVARILAPGGAELRSSPERALDAWG